MRRLLNSNDVLLVSRARRLLAQIRLNRIQVAMRQTLLAVCSSHQMYSFLINEIIVGRLPHTPTSALAALGCCQAYLAGDADGFAFDDLITVFV